MEEKIVTKCPICKDGDMIEKEKLFVCSNSKSSLNEETEKWEETGTCSYKIFKSSLSRFGKPNISAEEVKELCENGKLEVELVSKKQTQYKAITNVSPEWGIQVDFNAGN